MSDLKKSPPSPPSPSERRPPQTSQEFAQAAERIRKLAAKLPPEQRAEGMRHANNLLACARIRRRQVLQGRHSQHLTKQ